MKRILFPTLAIFLILALFSSCKETIKPEAQDKTDLYTSIYTDLLSTEYRIYTKDDERAQEHLENLNKTLVHDYDLFCPYQAFEIDGARLSAHLLKERISKLSVDRALDDLRGLKSQILLLTMHEDSDPYFSFLWSFEEEMYHSTKTAMDPMLDLYEWAEFEDMVECMNAKWSSLASHYLSPKSLDLEHLSYKRQVAAKICLDESVTQFNLAVNTDDWQNYSLCESAETLRNAYFEYVFSIISDPFEGEGPFLAKL